MAKYLPLPKSLQEADKTFIQDAITATEEVFKGDLFGEINRPLTESYTTPDGKYHWSTNKELLTYITDLTDTNDIKSANGHLYQTLTRAPEYTEATMTSAPEYPISATTPTKPLRAQQEEERAKREAGISAAREKGVQETRELIERLKNRKIKVTPKEEIPTVTLNKNEKETLFNLGKAAKIDPGTAQQKVEDIINQALEKSPNEIKGVVSPQTVTKAAVDLVEKAQSFADYKNAENIPDEIPSMHPASTIATLTNPDDTKLNSLITSEQERAILAENAQTISLALEAERNVNSTLTSALFPGSKNITNLLYGPSQITQFQIADDQRKENEDGADLDIREVIDRGRDIRNIWQKFANRATTSVSGYTPSLASSVATESSTLLARALPATIGTISGFGAGTLTSYWISHNIPMLMSPQISGLLTSNTMTSMITSSNLISSRILFDFSAGRFSLKVATGTTREGTKLFLAGTKFGDKAFGILAGKSTTSAAIGTISAQAGTKATISTVSTGLLAALGSWAPIVGTAIGAAAGWVIGKIAEKIPWDKVKEYSAAVLGFFAGLITLPFLGLGAAIGIGVGTTMVSAALGGGIGGLGLAGFGLWISGFFRRIGSAFIISVATPVIIFLLVFPVVVALILFIINSGAYIVPPSLQNLNIGGFSSPYVDLKKTVSTPGNPFANSDLSKTITYTISIKPKKGNLNNVQLSYDCQVVSKNVSKCPDITIEDKYKDVFRKPIESVSSTGISFTYTATYGFQFKDSATIDSIKLNGISATDNASVTTETSASVTFGTPPITCPVLGGHAATPSLNFSYNASKNTGHGSAAYWKAMGGSPYRYPLPQSTSCIHPSDCSYYGYAYDVFPTGSQEVFAPTVLGKDAAWNCSYAFVNPGAGNTYHCISSDGDYMLSLTHMASGAKTGTIKSGEKIGKLFVQPGNTHLHIEFQLNGRYVKPENYFCGGK